MPEEKKFANEYVKSFYDKFLNKYQNDYTFYRWQRTPISRYHYQQSKRVFLKVIRDKKYNKILEVGGGDGEWTKYLINNVGMVDFYDISEEMIKRAKKRLSTYNNIEYIQGDFLENSLPSSKYDCLLLFRSFEYFHDKNKTYQEFDRLLKSKGDLILITKSPNYDWKKYYQTKVLHSGLVNIFELKKELIKKGFKIKLIKPAIIGKGLRFIWLRFLFDFIHSINSKFKFNILPLFIWQYISESFIVYAKK